MSLVRPANVSSPAYNPSHLVRASASKRLENLLRKSAPEIMVNGIQITTNDLVIGAEDAKVKHLSLYAASLSPQDLVYNAYKIANVMRQSR